MASGAILYEDYIKIRNAKEGEEVTLSDGTKIVVTKIGNIGNHRPPTKHMNLDFYDGTYTD